MSHQRRLLVIVVAWVLPIAWIAAALLAGPSDGTSISSSTATVGADRWGETVTIARSYGGTPLEAGDIVLTVDGRSVGEWVSTEGSAPRTVGDVVRYEVRRPAPELDRILVLDVTLTTYPVTDAVAEELPAVALALLLLLAGSLVFWRRPTSVASVAFLTTTALLPAALTASPWGLGAIDLAGGRGVWPHAGGQVLCALGIATALVTAATLTGTPAWLGRHPWAALAAVLVPLTGYAVWALAVDRSPEAAQLQAMVTVVGPAILAATPVILAILAYSYARSTDREDRLATRLVLLGAGSAVGARLLLGDLPQRLTGEPLLPWSLLTLLTVPALVGCVVVAILRYRLGEIEPTVRRALVQALVVALVGSAFIGLVGAVDLASDISFESMLAGGLVALLLLPVAVGLQRTLRRLVYGDREFPHRVVSDLRRLDPMSAPEEALQETLALLARRLHLSYAAIDVFASTHAEAIATATGEPRGAPVTVDLVVGGATLGRLRLEVDPGRDPFGPGDRRLLEDVGSQVGALVQAVSVNRELQRSRQRLVAAREEERRRIRRDLHDGLGPSLATMAMRLDAAHDLIPDDPEQAAHLVGRLSEQARSEIAEVRRLVDGLRPPTLDQLGLVSALGQRADEHNLGAPTGAGPRMVWILDAADDVEPLPAAVEVAAYRIVVEAVNNAQRHSAADRCVVTLRRNLDVLHLTISDTGTGLAPDRVPGVGLSSMRERAEELGGTCTWTSTAGAGTVIDVVLPLAGQESGG